MTALYRSVGDELAHYQIDVEAGTLAQQAAVRLPAKVQYVWPHPSKRYLYVISSEGAAAAGSGKTNHISAFRIGPDGALHAHGEPQPLSHRPIHMSLDATGTYAVTAYNNPSAVTVHRIAADGTLGPQVKQPGTLDTGIYAHQVRFTPSNRTVILVTRGNNASASKPEDPGALKLFRFHDGLLTNLASVAPNGGFGFGPRHLDFHPTRPWVYVALERQNKLQVYALEGEALSSAPLFTRETLAEPGNLHPRQMVGTVHVHPSGRFVYVANRADHKVDFSGTPVFAGGENSLVAYEIDQKTGEPTFIQRVDPRSFHVRTFSIDPSARVLIAANILPMPVRDGAKVVTVPAALSVFRIGNDGRLEFLRKYDVDAAGRSQWWMGII